jgi:hypothetical protein
MDLMFADKLTYLVLIGANTRYLYAQHTNYITTSGGGINASANDGAPLALRDDVRTAAAIRQALTEILKRLPVERRSRQVFIIGDGERAFAARDNMKWYTKNGIAFKPVRRIPGEKTRGFNPTSAPNHTSLSIIDRAIRSIRDIGFRAGIKYAPAGMNQILSIYNRAPNDTLTKIMRFMVSPEIAENDLALEFELIRRFTAQNIAISQQPGFILPLGSHVVMYNPIAPMTKRRAQVLPHIYEVVGYRGLLYEIKADGMKNTIIVSRRAIKPLTPGNQVIESK